MWVILLWPSKIKVPWFWCIMCLMFEFLRTIGWKTCFWKILVEFKCFWKTFRLILMHFIHEILCFEEFLSFLPNFYNASFMFRIHMHCIVFLYPSCSFAVISLIVFTHNMHTLCYIGYSTWSKNWLINFWVMYFLVYAIFMCEL